MLYGFAGIRSKVHEVVLGQSISSVVIWDVSCDETSAAETENNLCLIEGSAQWDVTRCTDKGGVLNEET